MISGSAAVRGKCPGCGAERQLIDGRLCGACHWIESRSSKNYEWTEEEADIQVDRKIRCDGCDIVRPLRTITNKKTKQTLSICKPCSIDGMFKTPEAAWRKRDG